MKRKSRIRLGVNIDHVATLRQARYKAKYKVSPRAEPHLIDAVRAVERAGGHGITIHLREDRRHIQDADVWMVREKSRLPINLEMAANNEILKIALKLKPDEVCLVPEKREEVTTEGGLDVIKGGRKLRNVIQQLQKKGIVVSLFIAPDLKQIHEAAACGVEYIEIHTGSFAEATSKSAVTNELQRLINGAELAHALGLKVNAGHGINYSNIRQILKMPHLDTLNIGHSIVSRAITIGLEEAVREMLKKIR